MEQSRIESLIEVNTNILSGFFISLGMWAFIIAPLMEHGYLAMDDSVTIVGMFTVTSVARSYFWRRFFARRFHLVVHNFVRKYKHG